MKRLMLLCVSLFFIGFQAFSQAVTVKGTVLDENGNPMPQVSVVEKGTKNGGQTGENGKFTISVSKVPANLVISYTGYGTQTVKADGKGDINVKLAPAASQTSDDDVVVVGYQTIKRKDLTASVSSVGAKDLKDVPVNSAAEMLNGRLAGVTATTAEGSPDADVRIRVRNGMSITGDNSPLYIIDGVQVENGLSTISPQDIQNIDVLKDAAATAIYGARGGNGVIIITTKSGKQGKLKLSYNGFVGIKKLASQLDVMNPYDFVIYQSERSRGNASDSATFMKNYGTYWDTLSVYKNVPEVNWQEEAFGQTGITQTHNITANGGTKKYTYNFAYTYNDEKAIVLNSKYKRHLLNFKGDYKITKQIKVGLSTRYTNQNVLGAGVSDDKGTAYNRLRNAVKYRPFLSEGQDVDDEDPNADQNVGNGLSLTNPIQLSNAEFREKTTNAFNATANLNYNITKNLSFRSTFGYDYNDRVDLKFYDSISPYAKIQGGNKPIAGLDTITRNTITNSNVLTYTLNNYKGKHDISVLVGEETYDLKTETHNSLYKDYPTYTSSDEAFKNTGLGNSFDGYPRLAKTRYTSLSFFGRVNYSLLDRYILSLNVRADGASKFKPGKQWGVFPAASFAWRLTGEKFLRDVKFLNDVKLRVGYGELGNNRINDYLYFTSFSSNGLYYYGLNGQAVNAYYPASLVNENLKWESTVNKNIGLDVAMLNNRINFSIDYYNNDSKDLLLEVPVASTFGYAKQFQNIGKTNNKGMEFQLGAVIFKKSNGFNWNANFNISFNRNEIVQLGQGQKQFFPDASWGVSGQPVDYIQRIGSPVGSMWGLVSDGFYTLNDFDYNTTTGAYTLKSGVATNSGIIGVVQPGSIKFKDLDGDGKVDLDHDRQIIGNPTPKFFGGLSQQFTYRQWDASVFVNFSYGNDVYNANKIEFTNAYSNNANMLDLMVDRWSVIDPTTGATTQWVKNGVAYGLAPEALSALNADAKIWQPIKAGGAFYPSSWAIEDGSYLRINNVTIGYSLPVKALVKLRMSKLRFYFTGNNLAVFTDYSGYDPEVSVRNSPLTPGLDYSAYPKSRSFIFGVNATF